ncbi:UNVERIFIED_CONTAM: hypothetical protein LK11_16205 [Mumia flava]
MTPKPKVPLHRRLSLAARISLLTTVAVGVVLAFVSAIVFVSVRAEFESSLDENLLRRAGSAVEAGIATELVIRGLPPSALVAADVKLAVIQNGRVYPEPVAFVGPAEQAVAQGAGSSSFRTVELDGTPYRVVSVSAGADSALVIAQSMSSMQSALDRLQAILWGVSIFGVLVAGLLGSVVASSGLRPVRRLTYAVEQVAVTEQLRPIEVRGSDDLARLTIAYNQMMAALSASQDRQRQLVADAGHELRTPLTSLKTNIELLGQAETRGGMAPEARRELIDDVRAQLDELTTLVGDLVELARDSAPPSAEPLDLAEVVATAVERVQRRAPGLEFDVRTEPWTMVGEWGSIERAVTNLLDNAAKWSPPLDVVTVRLHDGVLTVADNGPGISDEDLPHVFDRFYRSREARRMPGSGLGLAIVAQAATRHHGEVSAARGSSGGTVMRLRLPGRLGAPDEIEDADASA